MLNQYNLAVKGVALSMLYTCISRSYSPCWPQKRCRDESPPGRLTDASICKSNPMSSIFVASSLLVPNGH